MNYLLYFSDDFCLSDESLANEYRENQFSMFCAVDAQLVLIDIHENRVFNLINQKLQVKLDKMSIIILNEEFFLRCIRQQAKLNVTGFINFFR